MIVTVSPGSSGRSSSMNMMWSPPGASSWSSPAATVNPPSLGCMAIDPSSAVTVSCSSITSARSLVAPVTTTSSVPSLTRVPKAAVMPLSAALTHGSASESDPACVVVVSPAAGVVSPVPAVSSPQAVSARARAAAPTRAPSRERGRGRAQGGVHGCRVLGSVRAHPREPGCLGSTAGRRARRARPHLDRRG